MSATPDLLHVECNGVLDTSDGTVTLRVTLCHQGVGVGMTVAAHFPMPCGGVLVDTADWLFARDLLDEAMSRPMELIGQGDVKVRRVTDNDRIVVDGVMLGEDIVRITLVGQRGDRDLTSADVVIPADAVTSFMSYSLAMEPCGSEHVDVDGAIEKILGGSQ